MTISHCLRRFALCSPPRFGIQSWRRGNRATAGRPPGRLSNSGRPGPGSVWKRVCSMAEKRPKMLSLRSLLQPSVQAQPQRRRSTATRSGPTAGSKRRRTASLAAGWPAASNRVTGSPCCCPIEPETLLVYLACFKSGLVAVPLDYRYRPPQINFVLRHSGSRYWFPTWTAWKRWPRVTRHGTLTSSPWAAMVPATGRDRWMTGPRRRGTTSPPPSFVPTTSRSSSTLRGPPAVPKG